MSKKVESHQPDMKKMMGEDLFDVDLYVHVKITSVRSYKKLLCVET